MELILVSAESVKNISEHTQLGCALPVSFLCVYV